MENKIVKKVKQHKLYLLVAVIYLAIALINFWPVTINITTTVAGYGGDPYQMLWHLWWVPYSLFTLHHGIYNTNLLFWPVGANLVYETMIPIAALMVAPLHAISLAFSYNVIFFFGFMLSGLAMFILAKYLTNNNYAAFIAGIIFSFSAFHIAQAYGHLEWTNLEWVPLAIYVFLRMLREDTHKYKKAIYLAIILVLDLFTAGIEQGLMTLIILALVLIMYLCTKKTRELVISKRFVTSLGIVVFATFILGIWAFVPIISTLAKGGTQTLNSLTSVQSSMLWSDDLLSFFLPSFYNGIFTNLSTAYIAIYHQNLGETTSYIGYTVLALVILGIYKEFKSSRMWIVIAIVGFVLALGPILQINTKAVGLPLPYLLLLHIPVLNTLREPGRFAMLLTLGSAVIAAFGAKSIFEHLKKTQSGQRSVQTVMVFVVIVALLLFETNGLPISKVVASAITTQAYISPVYKLIAHQGGNFSVLNLPILPNSYSYTPNLYPGRAQYYQTTSHVPIVGGYTTRENITQQLSVYQIPLTAQTLSLETYGNFSYTSPVIENYTNESLLTLFNYDTGFVVLDKTAFGNSTLPYMENYLYSVFGSPVYNDNYTVAFETSQAINRTLYRSFVAYPILTDWAQASIALNGSDQSFWAPQNDGAVVVYAPYRSSGSGNIIISSTSKQILNGTIRFYAVAYSSTLQHSVDRLNIYEQGSWIDGAGYKQIAAVNVTPYEQAYQINASFISGPTGTALLFVESNQTSEQVLMKNITVS